MTTWTHPRHPLIEAGMMIRCGKPRIAGSRWDTASLVDRFRGGDSVKKLARDYSHVGNASVIEAALRFEFDASAKRAWRKWYREGGK